jgi:hypothetical protein
MNSDPLKFYRAEQIRDLALVVIEKHGLWLPASKSALRIRGTELGRLRMAPVTPFSGIWQRNESVSSDLSDDAKYRAATLLQKAPVTPYWLDIWDGKKVFSVRWNDEGTFEVLTFKIGDWKAELEAAI